jgi:hypothetical protein
VSELTKPLLILEAVLSTYHAPSGNPDIRGDFERGRGWYWGAGVLTFAGALRFLHALNQELKGRELLLAEAFLSNKDAPTGHSDDAVLIHEGFRATQAALLKSGVEPASPLVGGVPSVRVFALSIPELQDDSLIDELLESNPRFQAMVAKSKAGPRKPFRATGVDR